MTMGICNKITFMATFPAQKRNRLGYFGYMESNQICVTKVYKSETSLTPVGLPIWF